MIDICKLDIIRETYISSSDETFQNTLVQPVPLQSILTVIPCEPEWNGTRLQQITVKSTDAAGCHPGYLYSDLQTLSQPGEHRSTLPCQTTRRTGAETARA